MSKHTSIRAGLTALFTVLAGLALVSAGLVSATVPGANGKIAYIRDGDVWVMNPDGSSQQNLTSSPDAESDPAFSHDATKIAFGRGNDIWVMDANGSNQANLTNDSAPDRDPDWSPDGTKIAFESVTTVFDSELGHDVDLLGIHVMAGDGTGRAPLRAQFKAGVDSLTPAWSPDGAKIAFTGNDTDSPRIATVNAADGTGYTLIGPIGGTSPSWSPDGTKIAFHDWQGGGASTMKADGTGVTAFGDPLDEPRQRLAWSPDGAMIAYEKFGRIFVSGTDGLGEVDIMGFDGSGAQPDWGVGAAVPPPATPTLSIAGATVTEGDSGTVNAEFTVTLSAASATAVAVDYATSDGTAGAPSDYLGQSGSLSLAPGATSETVSVAVRGDVFDEPNETFAVNLSNPSNATIEDGAALGTILDDDPLPTMSIDDVSVAEGDSGTTPASFSVSLSAASGREVSVFYQVSSGTATTPSDYQVATGTLTFSPGEDTRAVVVSVNGDVFEEPDETFTVDLQNAVNAALADGQGVGTILNDDDSPSISIADAQGLEPGGDSGFSGVSLVVSLSKPSGGATSVDFATADGTAHAPADYEAQSGTLEFAAGETTKAINVKVFADRPDEYDETFVVELSNAAFGTIADASATATIVDSDLPPAVVTFPDWVFTEGNSGTTPAVVSLFLSEPSEKVVSIDYATADLPGYGALAATSGVDYQRASGTITFTPGQTEAAVELLIVGDSVYENDERFALLLGPAVNAGHDEGSEITIRDDDGPEMTVGLLRPGEALTTDVEGDGATPSDPIETSVTTPTGGFVSISELVDARGGMHIWIQAPSATPANPLVIVYRVDPAALSAGTNETNLRIFRNGIEVPECTNPSSGQASPDPCVSRRERLPDGDVAVTVLTSRASEWIIGRAGSSVGSAAGALEPTSGGVAGFAVKSDGLKVQGALGFATSDLKYAGKVTTLVIAPSGKAAWLGGLDSSDRPFLAYIEDNGRNGKGDVFKLWIDGVAKTGDGRLARGDVVIKR